MSHWKKVYGKREDRRLATAGFFAPFFLAVIAWPLLLGPGVAQVAVPDPSTLLQQVQRGGLGGAGSLTGNGVSDTIGQQSQNQTLSPQSMFATPSQPPSRLEQILSARAGARLRQFGYDQLGVGRQIVVPETGAVADDYVMGPGDEVVISLRGQENSDIRSRVDREGRVVLPRLPPIPATGRSFGNFRQDVDAAVRRAYVASTASVAIGRIRQISVLVSGEVMVPGQRLVTGLSSVVDALLLSNGVKKTGSLRNIRIQRQGRDYTVDLYSVLTGTGSGGAMRLADGDRVVVPPLGPTVAVTGLVRRPGIFELPARSTGMTARALLALAGGQEVRGQYRLSVQRIEADGRLNLESLHDANGVVRDSEILRVELGADLAGAQATLSGGTGLAGQYPVIAGTHLSDVIKAPGALGPTPYTLFGIIVRKDPRTLLRSLMAFTPVAVLNGTEDQLVLSDDVIRPISVNEAQMLSFVLKSYLDKLALDQARIRNPLEAQRADTAAQVQATVGPSSSANNAPATTTSYSVAAAQTAAATAVSPNNPFGLAPDAIQSYAFGQEDFSSVPSELQRANIVALLDVATPGTLLAQQRQLAYQQALLAANSSTANQSSVQAAQAQQAAFLAAQTSTPLQAFPPAGQPAYGTQLATNNQTQSSTGGGAIGPDGSNGQNGFNGQSREIGPDSAVRQPALNFQDQPANPGEYASNREARTFGELMRQLDVDPLVLVNFLIDHRARLDGAVMGPGSYLVGTNASLADLVQAAGGTVSWADESGVELFTTAVDSSHGRAASQRQNLPLRQGMLASYIVRARDQFHFNKVFTDSGLGSVTVQGEVRFGGNYPITRGEHLSDVLMRAGGLTSTAYPRGTVFLRKSAAQVEQEGYNRAANEIQSQLVAGMARLGSDKIPGDAVSAIQGFVNQLRTQKPLGRIAIGADPAVLAANPAMDPLLEAGDVVFIPQRPSTVAVLGEVMQPGSYAYRSGMSVRDYIDKAGGYAQFSNEDMTYIVQPDGSARRLETSWLHYDSTPLPPGSTIVIPRDLAPLNTRQIVLDVTGIMSSLAVTIASLAILAKQ